MGAATCKSPKSTENKQEKEDSKKITIGVFGLDNAGKTSTVKAIEGVPTSDAEPTVGSKTSQIPYPTTGKGEKKSQERITIIDVSGVKRNRERLWSEYYKQIHGLIFVIDASEKKRIMESKDTLEDLLENGDLKDKPILILANKQDRKGAIDAEDDIKDKFDIESLRRKYKIELCSALPQKNNKADDSIRQGFSWLIRTIEDNYTQLNSLVNNTKNSRPPRPMERKSQMNTRQKNEKSDQSDDDDGVVVPHTRRNSPPLTRKTTDYRSPTTPFKLPNLDLNKIVPKASGHETYSESDNDDGNRSRSRPNISRPDDDKNHRNQSFNLPALTTAGAPSKKKKVIGATGHNNDVTTKRSNDNEPKSFRASYEPFPEDAPWSSSARKTTKPDDMSSRSFTKPSITNEPTKRTISPLVHDTKLYNSSSISKRDNASDDDDDDRFSQKQKIKPTIPSMTKPSSTFKKPLYSIPGADDDEEEDSKKSNINRFSNFNTPKTTKKPYERDDDDDNDYLKKTTSKTTKNPDSDDEWTTKSSINKNFQRPVDRFNLTDDYRGITTKPPPSPSVTTSRFKPDDDAISSSLSKTINRSKVNKDDYSFTIPKPATSSRFNNDDNDDDGRPLSTSKITAHSKYGDDNQKPLSKSTARPKYDDDDDDLPSASKPLTRPKYGDDNRSSSPVRPVSRTRPGDDDRPFSSKVTARSKYGDDDDDNFPSSSKPITRTKFDSDKRSSSPFKPTTHSKFDDDDDYGSSSKPTIRSRNNDDDDDLPSASKALTRSKYGDDNRSSSPLRPTSRTRPGDDDRSFPSKVTTRSKYDDDDDDRPLPSKATTRSKYDDDDDDRPLPSKATTRSKYNDDDDDRPLPSKATTRSKYDDDDDYGSSTKPTTRSNFKDNHRSSSPSKPSSYSKFDDDDDDKPSTRIKPASRSNFDDDDYPSSPKKNNYSSRDDDYSGTGGARSRFDKDEFDSSKGVLNSGRAASASTNRFRINPKSDT